jgi:hypothetical protein
MMRKLVMGCLCVAAAACGGGEENKQVAAEAPDTLPAGTWKSAFEVKSFASADKAPTPALKAKQGDKEEASNCVGEADRAKPSPALFAGSGYQCTYANSYVRGGMINATLNCTRPELKGPINMTVSGSFDADSFEATVETASFLPGDGDFKMTRKVEGELTPGACQAAAPDAKVPTVGQAGRKGG